MSLDHGKRRLPAANKQILDTQMPPHVAVCMSAGSEDISISSIDVTSLDPEEAIAKLRAQNNALIAHIGRLKNVSEDNKQLRSDNETMSARNRQLAAQLKQQAEALGIAKGGYRCCGRRWPVTMMQNCDWCQVAQTHKMSATPHAVCRHCRTFSPHFTCLHDSLHRCADTCREQLQKTQADCGAAQQQLQAAKGRLQQNAQLQKDVQDLRFRLIMAGSDAASVPQDTRDQWQQQKDDLAAKLHDAETQVAQLAEQLADSKHDTAAGDAAKAAEQEPARSAQLQLVDQELAESQQRITELEAERDSVAAELQQLKASAATGTNSCTAARVECKLPSLPLLHASAVLSAKGAW